MRDDDANGLGRGERLTLMVTALALMIVVIVVIGRIAERGGEHIGGETDRPTPAAHVPLPISVADGYLLAKAWAHTWNDDAYLILVSARFEYTDSSPFATPVADGGMIVFSFAAPREGDEWPRASVVVSRQAGTIFFDETTAFAVEPPPPIGNRLLELPISAEQAFNIANGVVGESYRAGCEPSRRQVQVNLDTIDPEHIYWVVVYYDMRQQDKNAIVVRINAETGDLNQEIRGNTSCDVELRSPGVVTYQATVQGVHLLIGEDLDRERAAVAP